MTNLHENVDWTNLPFNQFSVIRSFSRIILIRNVGSGNERNGKNWWEEKWGIV